MKTRRIMIPDSLWESIQQEAEGTGLDTGEYMREILRDHMSAGSKTHIVNRVDELEERLDRLEGKVNTEADSGAQKNNKTIEEDSEENEATDAVQESKTAVDEILTDVMDGVDQQSESSEEYPDYIKQAINNTFSRERSDYESEQLEEQRATAAAALRAAVNAEEAMGRRELVDRFYDEDMYTSRDSFWKQTVRPVLQQVGNYSRREGGYVFPEL